jgi:hypothetical protein
MKTLRLQLIIFFRSQHFWPKNLVGEENGINNHFVVVDMKNNPIAFNQQLPLQRILRRNRESLVSRRKGCGGFFNFAGKWYGA